MLLKIKAKVQHQNAMPWRDLPMFYADLAAHVLRFTILTASRASEELEMK